MQKKYYVIVPEQFSLEMQRKMVKKHPRHGFFNIDVLSFHRLAYRIFDECGYQPGEILEDLGVSMMLRKILSEGEKAVQCYIQFLKDNPESKYDIADIDGDGTPEFFTLSEGWDAAMYWYW